MPAAWATVLWPLQSIEPFLPICSPIKCVRSHRMCSVIVLQAVQSVPHPPHSECWIWTSVIPVTLTGRSWWRWWMDGTGGLCVTSSLLNQWSSGQWWWILHRKLYHLYNEPKIHLLTSSMSSSHIWKVSINAENYIHMQHPFSFRWLLFFRKSLVCFSKTMLNFIP